MFRLKKERNGGFLIEDTYGARIADFDNLTAAALVLRFLRGNKLSEKETREVRNIMFEYDKRTKAGKIAEGDNT